MSKHEQQIREHCARYGIAVETLPSGAVRFTGPGLCITCAAIADVTVMNLTAYAARRFELRNV